MSWATVVILDGARTRAWRRYTSATLASRAASYEAEVQDAPDHTIVHAGTLLASLDDAELKALLKQGGIPGDGEKPALHARAKAWLATFGEEHDRLSEAAAALMAREDPSSAKEAAKERHHAERSGEKAAAEPVANDKTAVEKQKKVLAPRPAKRRGGERDPMGKPGTLARFMHESILKGLDDEALLKAARKAFPQNAIRDYYPGWYRGSMRRKGLLKGDAPAKRGRGVLRNALAVAAREAAPKARVKKAAKKK